MTDQEFITQMEDAHITEAIRDAEANTSGEIRVFISSQPSDQPLDDARREFHRLGMTRTPGRNAVLLYFSPKSARFALYGDEGIHLRVEESFWTQIAQEMEGLLQQGKVSEAVLRGVRRAGMELSRHFPKNPGDRNDLPDAIIRD